MYENLLADVPTDLWIGGKWRKSSDGGRFDVLDPATGRGPSVATRRSRTPRAAWMPPSGVQPWAARSARERSEILRKVYELIMADLEPLARLVTIENGKALRDARGEVAYAAEFFRWNAEEAVRITGEFGLAPSGANRIIVDYQPIGVCVLVTPWNFPAAMATRKIAPALAAGCTVVLKPAIETPLTARADALLEEGRRSPGRRQRPYRFAIRSRPLRRHAGGSTGAETVVHRLDRSWPPPARRSGQARHLVLDGTRRQRAVHRLRRRRSSRLRSTARMVAKMRNVGEACTAANRIYVQSGIHDAFAEGLRKRMTALKVGAGRRRRHGECGPMMHDDKAVDKIDRLVQDAVARGARVLCGGTSRSGDGHFLSADRARRRAGRRRAAAQEEIFGPVARDLALRAGGRGDRSVPTTRNTGSSPTSTPGTLTAACASRSSSILA